MDRTNCSEGWASDRVMLYGDDFRPGSCDVNISLYVALFSILTVIRTALLFVQAWIWNAQRERKKHRYPIGLFISAIQIFALFLFTILTSLNIANAANGGTAALLMVYYYVMIIYANLAERKLLRLGYKLIPLSQKTLDSNLREDPQDFVKWDSVLKVLFHVGNLPFLLLPIFAIILGCIVYPDQYFTAQAGFACYVLEDIVLCGAFAYQYQRLINAISSVMNSSDHVNSSFSESRRAVEIAIKRMRFQQFSYVAVGALASLIWLLNITRVVLPAYWYCLIHFGIESVFLILFFLGYACTMKKKVIKTTTNETETVNNFSSMIRPKTVLQLSTFKDNENQ